MNFILLVMLSLGFTVSAYAAGCLKPDNQFLSQADGCFDRLTGLVWGGAMSFSTDYETANEYCTKGHGGAANLWRLPTNTELSGVAREVAMNVFGWQHPNRFFWTQATPNLKRTLLIMPSSDFKIAPEEVYEDRATFRGGVTCVRKVYGCVSDDPGYQSGNGGCYQFATGLTWSTLSPAPISILRAEGYCAQLRQSGFNDWRVPEPSHLTSLGKTGANALFGQSFQGKLWGGPAYKVTDVYGVMYNMRLAVDSTSGQTSWQRRTESNSEAEVAHVACVRYADKRP